MFRKKITLKILSLLIFSDMLETITHLFFKKSTFLDSGFTVNNLLDVFIFLRMVFFSPFLWCGLLSVLLTFIIWSTIISKIDLSVAVPLASFSYILVPTVSIILLHEKISLLRWSGIIFIIMGVKIGRASCRERV